MATCQAGNSSVMTNSHQVNRDQDCRRNSDQDGECSDETTSDTGTVRETSCHQDDHKTTDAAQVPIPWPEDDTSVLILCVLAAAGLLISCATFLPGKHSTSSYLATFYSTRNIVFAFLTALAVSIISWLSFKVSQLHEQGLVLWPTRCKHCLKALILIHPNDKSISRTRDTLPRNKMSDVHMEESALQSSGVSKVALNITYIFVGLVMFSFVVNIFEVIMCFNASPDDPKAETNPELIAALLSFLAMFICIYILGFHFIPNYYDAHFVAVPKIRWTFLFCVELAIWSTIKMLVRPFNFLGDSESYTIYHCALNGTSGEILKGLIDISQPFMVEVPIMVTWLLIEIWCRFVTPHARFVSKDIHKVCDNGCCLKRFCRRSNWVELWSFYNSFLRREKRSFDRLSLQESNDDERLDIFESAFTNERADRMSYGSQNGNSSHFRRRDNVESLSYWPRHRSNRTLTTTMEIVMASTLLVCAIYFGISNLLLAGDSEIRGRYQQWLVRMAFFSPELVTLFKHTIIARKDCVIDLERRARRSTHSSSNGNKNFLLLTLSGACLYEMSCLFSSVGNLIADPELSNDEMALNIVSVFTGVFGILRKCLQSVFLLRVLHQQPRHQHEKKWTLICLVAVGMANATQWMWDSLIHEAGSPVAWPVLAMFFDGKVGLVIGMVFVPFLHLYELHTATMAYEIYRCIWDVKFI